MREVCMHDQELNRNDRVRSLENWLPLAQSESLRHGWNLSATELEQLVTGASTSLEHVTSLLGAQAVLWWTHQLLQKERS